MRVVLDGKGFGFLEFINFVFHGLVLPKFKHLFFSSIDVLVIGILTAFSKKYNLKRLYSFLSVSHISLLVSCFFRHLHSSCLCLQTFCSHAYVDVISLTQLQRPVSFLLFSSMSFY